MPPENETIETNETILTDDPIQNDEQSVADAFYDSEDSQSDEPADETKEETLDSESENESDSEVTESTEETESDETEETTEDTDKEVVYKFEREEGSVVTDEMLEDYESFARENELSPDVANGLLKTQEKLLGSWVAKQTEALEAEKDGWREQIINDNAMGGDNLKITVANSRKAVDRFASPEFVSLLRNTGYGDHPEVVKFFSKVGSLLNDDVLVNGSEFSGEKTAEELFYGNN